jgi:hypothetical protein
VRKIRIVRGKEIGSDTRHPEKTSSVKLITSKNLLLCGVDSIRKQRKKRRIEFDTTHSIEPEKWSMRESKEGVPQKQQATK